MKIIRDKLADIIPGENIDYVTQDQGTELLKAKLFEEISELMSTNWKDVEEYADILEILLSLAERHGIDSEAVELARKSKVNQRGRFENNVVFVK